MTLDYMSLIRSLETAIQNNQHQEIKCLAQQAALAVYQAACSGDDFARMILEGRKSRDLPKYAITDSDFQVAAETKQQLAREEKESGESVLATALQYLMGLGVQPNGHQAFTLLSNWVVARRIHPGSTWSEQRELKGPPLANDWQVLVGKVCHLLGWMYRNGQGVTRDYQIAVQWFRQAAALCNALAMNSLGRMHEYGRGVALDYQIAVQWFRQAAALGNASAMSSLGSLYQNGRGVKKDDQAAAQWFQQAAALGNTLGMGKLAWMHEYGHGVAKDYQLAVQWLRQASALGNALAMYSLGRMHEFGRGVDGGRCPQNQWRAVYWVMRCNQRKAELMQLGRFDISSLSSISDEIQALASLLASHDEKSTSSTTAIETAVVAALSVSDYASKAATFSQLCQEMRVGRYAIATPAARQALVTVFDPTNNKSLFYSLLTGVQNIDLLMSMCIGFHHGHVDNMPLSADEKSEHKSTDNERLYKPWLETLARLLAQSEDRLKLNKTIYNQLMTLLLSHLTFPKRAEDVGTDYALLKPFISNLLFMQGYMDLHCKLLLVSNIHAYLEIGEGLETKSEESVDDNFDYSDDRMVSDHFNSTVFQGFHQQALAKADQLINPRGLEDEELPAESKYNVGSVEENKAKLRESTVSYYKGKVKELENKLSQVKANVLLQAWLEKLKGIHRHIFQFSFWLVVRYGTLRDSNGAKVNKVPKGIAAIAGCLKELVDARYIFDPDKQTYVMPDRVREAFNKMKQTAGEHLQQRNTCVRRLFKSTAATMVYTQVSDVKMPGVFANASLEEKYNSIRKKPTERTPLLDNGG